MAWVTQKFNHSHLMIDLYDDLVFITQPTEAGEQCVCLDPDGKKEDAHAWAMMLRKAARRLEEIGKELE